MGQGQRSRSNFGTQRSILGAQLCRVQQRRIITHKFETKRKRAEKIHYQSEVFVCVSTNCADAVDRLLILSFVLECKKRNSNEITLHWQKLMHPLGHRKFLATPSIHNSLLVRAIGPTCPKLSFSEGNPSMMASWHHFLWPNSCINFC